MYCKKIQAVAVTLIVSFNLWALSGTGGVPIGGMGTGYVKFDGQKFCVSGKYPPAAADHCCDQSRKEPVASASGFHFFVNGTVKNQAKAVSEDAKCPLQTFDFGTINNVKFTMDAFGPYWPGEGKEKYQLATSPLAFFNVTAINNGAADVDVAVAMEFGQDTLLARQASKTGKVDGNKAIIFSGNPENAYLMVDCDGASPTFSAGDLGTFSTNGILGNKDGNLVAAKCNIPAGGKVNFKFVLAWYRDYFNEDYYYHNFYKDSKEAATFGMSKFDQVRDGLKSFVNRLMASNFPEWYKDRLLNNTYPLIHNSVCAKDGRVAFWEGKYGIIGTIDQGQHAATFYIFNWPTIQWHELQYWARQQKTSREASGQIHHDFNQGTPSFTPGSTANNRHLLLWDDKTHADYWWFSNTDTWADLNCMFIFKAYELMLATGEKDSLEKYWTNIKKAANRLLAQCGSNSKLPLECHSTYDRCDRPGSDPGAKCSLTPEYNGGLAIATYLAVSEMAKFLGDNETANTFYENFKAAKEEYKKLYANSSKYAIEASTPNSGRFPESHVAGYSWANYLCLEPIMDESFITMAVERLRKIQKENPSRVDPVRATGEWIFYCVDHYGGAEIAINRPDDALSLHKLDYDYYYKQVPHMVLWQSLQESDRNTGKNSYMTAPVVWHSYFQFCGYMIDNANKRLWIRPRIPSEMKGKITNALLLNPKCLGTLNYEESSNGQCINVAYDAPGVTISEIVLKNNTGSNNPPIKVNGEPVTKVTAEDKGIEKNLRIKFDTPITIGPQGIVISVNGMECKCATCNGVLEKQPSLEIKQNNLTVGKTINFTLKREGFVSIEVVSITGKLLGTIMKGNFNKGDNKFIWDGKTIDGKTIRSGFVILKVSTPDGTVSKPVFINRL